MSVSVRLNRVTICYPHLFEPHAPPGADNAKYGAEFLLDPVANKATIDEVNAAFKQVATDAGKGASLQYLKNPLRSGDQMNAERAAKGQTPRGELEGKYVLRASDPKMPPAVVNAQMQPITQANQAMIFGGCVVNAFVDLYWSGNAVNPGVYCGLKGVQLVDNVNVERLGEGRPGPEQMFEKVEGAPAPQQPVGGPGPVPIEVPW